MIQKFLLKHNLKTQVTRDGIVQTLSTDELVVGDIMTITSGDAIDVDLLVVEGNFVEVDESSVTGVSGNKIKSSSSNGVISKNKF